MVDLWSKHLQSRGVLQVCHVSPTETPLSEEWLTQGQAECVEFITKKYSLAKLKDGKAAISLLESYEPRYKLK